MEMEYHLEKSYSGKNIRRFSKKGNVTIGGDRISQVDLSFYDITHNDELSSIYAAIRYHYKDKRMSKLCQFGMSREDLTRVRNEINIILNNWDECDKDNSVEEYDMPTRNDAYAALLGGMNLTIQEDRFGNKFDKDAIKDVVYNNPATIVLWNDGTKTVVKCQERDTYNPELGLAMCIIKKCCGNKGNYNDVFNRWLPEDEN